MAGTMRGLLVRAELRVGKESMARNGWNGGKGNGMKIWCQKQLVCRLCYLPLVMLAAGCTSETSTTATSETPSTSKATLEQETWEVVFLSGERVGYIHNSVFREPGPSGDLLRIKQDEVLTLISNNNRIETRTTMTSLETPDGQLLEFNSVLSQGQSPMETTGRVVGSELLLELKTTGQKTKDTLSWTPEFGGPYRVPGSLQSDPLAPGESRTLRYLDVGTNQLATSTLTAADFEETDLTAGRSRRLLRVESQTSVAGSTINSTLWADEGGEIHKEQLAIMYNPTSIRATKEEALQEVGQVGFDLGKQAAVPVERSLATPHATKRIVYRVHLDPSDPVRVFDSGLTQQVTAEDEHTALVTVYAIRPGDTSGNPQAQPEGTTAADLEPNNLIQSNDPAVAKLSQQVGSVDDPWQTAVALEKLVSTKMTSSGVSSAFATAAEVARDLKGDCTEHAVLLAALARARGIPARVAIGLVYYRQEYLYHMWTEVHVDGTWIPLDATLEQGGIGAAHLKITDSNLQGASPNAAFLPVTEVIGQLKVEILEVE